MKTRKHVAAAVMMTMMMLLLMVMSVNAAAISRKTATLTKGSTLTLSVSGVKSVSWSSNKKSVATVTSRGVVKAVNAGTATITATANKKKYTCKITVTNPPKATLKLDSNTVGMTAKEAAVYKKMLSMKSRYPEGKAWTNVNYYAWKGGIFEGGYGCSSFAFAISDAAFGTAPARRHTNFNAIKVGDIVRYKNNSHSVIVMKVVGSNLVVAEGNYNNKIHWGRVLTLAEVRRTGTYVMTRY